MEAKDQACCPDAIEVLDRENAEKVKDVDIEVNNISDVKCSVDYDGVTEDISRQNSQVSNYAEKDETEDNGDHFGESGKMNENVAMVTDEKTPFDTLHNLVDSKFSVSDEEKNSVNAVTSDSNSVSFTQDVAKSFCLRHDGTEERVKLVTSCDLECVNDNIEEINLPEEAEITSSNDKDDFKMNASVNHEHVGELWVTRNQKTYEFLPYTNIDKLLSKSGCEDSVFHDLPDELIVKIFSFLTTKELCQNVAPVCRKWRQISLDQSLWKCLDFSSNPRLSSLNLLWLVRRTPLLKKLVISGRMNVTLAEVAILTECCPAMQEIDFGFSDITSVMLKCLAENCPNLRKINIEGCDRLGEEKCVKCLVKCQKLTHLNFSHCIFIEDSDIIYLSSKLPEIKSINLDGISFLTDRYIHCTILTFI